MNAKRNSIFAVDFDDIIFVPTRFKSRRIPRKSHDIQTVFHIAIDLFSFASLFYADGNKIELVLLRSIDGENERWMNRILKKNVEQEPSIEELVQMNRAPFERRKTMLRIRLLITLYHEPCLIMRF